MAVIVPHLTLFCLNAKYLGISLGRGKNLDDASLIACFHQILSHRCIAPHLKHGFKST